MIKRLPTMNKGIRNTNNNRGAILIVVIWILVILTLLGTALSRRSSVDLSLAKYSVDKLKSRYLALAGFQYSLARIMEDSRDKDSQGSDTLFQCGVHLEGETLQEVFESVPARNGSFTVGYRSADPGVDSGMVFGFRDEERRLNLNGLDPQNYRIFQELLMILDVDPQTAQTIAASTVDWQDADQEALKPPYGEEGDGYQRLAKPYLCKNRPLDHVSELLLVKGMTPEIFDKVKDFVTVFPKRAGRLTVNFNTAPLEVLQALGRSVAGPQTNTTPDDADGMARKIVDFRAGGDGSPMTGDDRAVDAKTVAFNSKERAIFQTISPYRIQVSQVLRITVTGREEKRGVPATIDAVVSRNDLAILSWRSE